MEILRLDVELAEPIGRRPYETRLAAAAELLRGEGEAHAYLVRIGPGGEIGRHEAAFGQLFVALAGRGSVAGATGDASRSQRERRPSSAAASRTPRAATRA